MPSRQKLSAPVPRLAISSLYGEGRRNSEYEIKLIVSIDVGTTLSAAAFSILRPRCVPNLEIVSSWPGQICPDHKVPTVIYYDESGNPVAWGAETTSQDFKARAIEENLLKVEWFKLALRPSYLPFPILQSASHKNFILPPPPLVSARRAYVDFLLYMFDHIKSQICRHHSSGSELWDMLFPTMDVVFTIPNGWMQQQEIRTAAIAAGFMGSKHEFEALSAGNANDSEKYSVLMNEARKRISFVSEAEAAMVYAADSSYIGSWLQAGEDVLLCDAGGGTIDMTAYTVTQEHPLELREKFASKCIVAGALLINQYAKNYIIKKVIGTTWNNPQIIDQLIDEFERDTKRRFGPSAGEYGIGAGGSLESFKKANIRNGRLYVPSRDFEAFFEPTWTAIKTGILDIHKRSRRTTKNIVIIGGCANSSYAYARLESWGQDHGLKFAKPDGIMAKTVSHGALLWYLSKPVKRYITKLHYGSDTAKPIDKLCKGDYEGRDTVYRSDGVELVEDVWGNIVRMGPELDPNKEVSHCYQRWFDEGDVNDGSLKFEEKVYICRQAEPPTFITTLNGDPHPMIEHVCSIVVDLRQLFDLSPWQIDTQNDNKLKFKVLEFNISVINNSYSLEASATWTVKRRKVRGDARVILPT